MPELIIESVGTDPLYSFFEEIRKVHKGLHDHHIKKLILHYTISEILAGEIREGTFYPSYEIGKQWEPCNKNKTLTSLQLWQPRRKSYQEIHL